MLTCHVPSQLSDTEMVTQQVMTCFLHESLATGSRSSLRPITSRRIPTWRAWRQQMRLPATPSMHFLIVPDQPHREHRCGRSQNLNFSDRLLNTTVYASV